MEDVEVLSESVLDVRCRWCGHGRAIETFEVEDGEAPETAGGQAPAEAGGPPG